MAHFAQLDEDNKVLAVIVVNSDVLKDENGDEQESLGVAFCKDLYGADTNWKQTSYNTKKGKHWTLTGETEIGYDGTEILKPKVESDDQSKALRGNYAGIGDIYDETNDVFYGPEPVVEGKTFTLNTTEWIWEEDE